jgi:hypothetical protein
MESCGLQAPLCSGLLTLTFCDRIKSIVDRLLVVFGESLRISQCRRLIQCDLQLLQMLPHGHLCQFLTINGRFEGIHIF